MLGDDVVGRGADWSAAEDAFTPTRRTASCISTPTTPSPSTRLASARNSFARRSTRTPDVARAAVVGASREVARSTFGPRSITRTRAVRVTASDHRDAGSVVTASVLLEQPPANEGGAFVTWGRGRGGRGKRPRGRGGRSVGGSVVGGDGDIMALRTSPSPPPRSRDDARRSRAGGRRGVPVGKTTRRDDARGARGSAAIRRLGTVGGRHHDAQSPTMRTTDDEDDGGFVSGAERDSDLVSARPLLASGLHSSQKTSSRAYPPRFGSSPKPRFLSSGPVGTIPPGLSGKSWPKYDAVPSHVHRLGDARDEVHVPHPRAQMR